MKGKWISVLLVAALSSLAFTLPSFASVTPIDFTGFTGSGFSPAPNAGQLDSDIWSMTGWSNGDLVFGGTQTTTSTDYTRGTSGGGVTTGGVYAFTNVGSSGNTIFGIQPGGSDWAPGTLTLKVQNTTGATITDVYIAYNIWTRNDQGRSNSLNFSYSTDDATYTTIAALDHSTPVAADASPTWTSVSRSTTLTGINLANSSYLYLRWSGADVSGSGSRDEYGLDNIEVRIGSPTAITLSTLTAAAPLSPLAAALPALGLVAAGGVIAWRRRRA